MRFGVAIGLMLLGAAVAFCQTAGADVWLTFFHEAAQHSPGNAARATSLNGEPADYTPASVADTLGITAENASALIANAAACESAVQRLDASASALVFESRMQAAENGQASEAIAARLKELEARRVEIISSYEQRVKSDLGAADFLRLDEYVRLHAASGSFFPSRVALKKKL